MHDLEALIAHLNDTAARLRVNLARLIHDPAGESAD